MTSLAALAILVSCASRDREVAIGESSDALTANSALLRGASLAPRQLAFTPTPTRRSASSRPSAVDDGPGPRTGELSKYLKSQGIPAVFFMNGRHLATPLPPLRVPGAWLERQRARRLPSG